MDATLNGDSKLDLDVLIIDDAVAIRDTMRDHLEGSGIPAEQIREADTAKAGLDTFEQHPPDLVLLELVLPDIPGDELGAVLLNKHPEMTLVPLTALDSRDRRVRHLVSRGAADVLQKPIQPAALDNLLAVFRNQETATEDQASSRGEGQASGRQSPDPHPSASER